MTAPATTTLDPKPALVVIDLQKGVLGIPADPPVTDVLQRAAGRGRPMHSGLP